jgi:hypothetical protein
MNLTARITHDLAFLTVYFDFRLDTDVYLKKNEFIIIILFWKRMGVSKFYCLELEMFIVYRYRSLRCDSCPTGGNVEVAEPDPIQQTRPTCPDPNLI